MDYLKTLILMGIFQDKFLDKSLASKVLFIIILMLYEQFILVDVVDLNETVDCLVRLEFQKPNSYQSLLDGLYTKDFVRDNHIEIGVFDRNKPGIPPSFSNRFETVGTERGNINYITWPVSKEHRPFTT